MINVTVCRDINLIYQSYIERLNNSEEQKQTSYVVVPEQYTLFTDFHLLQDLKKDSLIYTQTKSFTSLAREVLKKTGGLKRPLISEVGKHMLIHHILEDNKDRLKLLKNATGSSGFVDSITEWIARKKASGISLIGLRDSIKESDQESIFALKIHDLLLILEAYEEALKDQYVDTEDRLHLFSEKVEEASYLRDVRFYIFSFNKLNHLEIEILNQLDLLGASIDIGLVIDEKMMHAQYTPYQVRDEDLFDNPMRTLRSIKKAFGDRVQISPLKCTSYNEIQYLAQNIFRYDLLPSDYSPKKVKLHYYKSTLEEVEGVANQILEKVTENSAKFSDFKIVVTDFEEYEPILRKVFSANKIPIFLDARTSISDNVLLSFIQNVLLMIKNHWDIDYLMVLLKSGLLPCKDQDIEVLELFVRSRRIATSEIFNKGLFDLMDAYVSNTAVHITTDFDDPSEDLTSMKNVTDTVQYFFSDLYVESKKKHTAKSWAVLLYEFFFSNDRIKLYEEFLQIHSVEPAVFEQSEQGMQIFADVLTQISLLFSDQILSTSSVVDLILSGLQQMSIGVVPMKHDQVIVGSILRSRYHEIQDLIVVGLSEDYFPEVSSEPSLFSDEELERITEGEGSFQSNIKSRISEQDLALYNILMVTKGTLTMSCARISSSNISLKESVRMKRVYDFYSQSAHGVLTKNERLPLNRYFAIKAMIDEINDFKRTKHVDAISLTPEIWQHYHHRRDDLFSRLWDTYGDQKMLTNKIPKNLTNSLYQGLNKTSVSRIEAFARCPYHHFIRYGIQPKEEPPFDLKYDEMGRLLHESIAIFTKDYFKDLVLESEHKEDEIKDISKKIFHQVQEQVIPDYRRKSKRMAFLLQRMEKTLYDKIRSILYQSSKGDFKPYLVETKFGDNGDLEALKLQIHNKTIEIEGYIDRVDISEFDGKQFVFIVDYKSGRKTLDLCKLNGGLDLQLALYLKATLDGSQIPLEPAGMFYVSLYDEMTKEDELPQDLLSYLLNSVQLQGFVIKDPNILERLDEDYADNSGTVLVFKGRKSKTEDKENVLSKDDMINLLEDSQNLAAEMLSQILEGIISPFPYEYKEELGCDFCEYKTICKFNFEQERMPTRRIDANNVREEGQ